MGVCRPSESDCRNSPTFLKFARRVSWSRIASHRVVRAYAAISSQFSRKPGPWRATINRDREVDKSSTWGIKSCKRYATLSRATWMGASYPTDHRRDRPAIVSVGALGPPAVCSVRWACRVSPERSDIPCIVGIRDSVLPARVAALVLFIIRIASMEFRSSLSGYAVGVQKVYR